MRIRRSKWLVQWLWAHWRHKFYKILLKYPPNLIYEECFRVFPLYSKDDPVHEYFKLYAVHGGSE